MKVQESSQRTAGGRQPGRNKAAALAVLLALGAAVPRLAQAQSGAQSDSTKGHQSVGFTASAEASAKEVGLPVYPGAKPHKEEGEDSSAAQLGLWGGAFGLKLVVLKLESRDAPEKIAAFYQKALGKYGAVLHCGEPAAARSDKGNSGAAKTLECGNDKPEAGGMLYKAGTKEKQHMVAVRPDGKGSLFQLVYLEARGRDNRAQ